MNHTTSKKHDSTHQLPKPREAKRHWPYLLVWLVPVLAAIMAGYYVYERMQDRGPLITIQFADATGLKAGESQVVHLGVQIGQVTGLSLSPDRKQALVQVRLLRSESLFAKKGSIFWIVRPEISTQEISGLGTVLSGPIIDAIPGTGEIQTKFTGLDKPPAPMRDGLTILLKTAHLERLQADSPVYFRGIQVGFIEDVQLSTDATNADIRVLILRRYVQLVKANSQFWVVSAVDLKGGIFSGIQLKVESLRALLSGGIAFATPEEKMGAQAEDGAAFVLNDEPKKEWLAWSPKLSINPDDTGHDEQNPRPPPPSQALRSAVEPH